MNETLAEKETGLSRVEQVYRTLRDKIMANEYAPGFQALEPELAKKLGVSRTPVREALIRLEAEKLIELIPRRGMRVLPLVPSEFFQISEVTIVLEVKAISLLVQRKPGADTLEMLRDALTEMDSALDKKDLRFWAGADEKFNRLLINLCGNERLAHIVESLRSQIYRARQITLEMQAEPRQTNEAYRAVYNAIAHGDADQACRVCRDHKNKVLHNLMELLDRYRLPHL